MTHGFAWGGQPRFNPGRVIFITNSLGTVKQHHCRTAMGKCSFKLGKSWEKIVNNG
jgi:hypothetical protein